MRIGVTGHQLRPTIDWYWVRAQLHQCLSQMQSVEFVATCLATGTDSIAAQEAIKLSIPVRAIIPHKNYEKAFEERERQSFNALLQQSSEVISISTQQDMETSYLVAGRVVVDHSDLLICVWDGKAAKGKGGTADVVQYANTSQKRVLWLDVIRYRVIEWTNA